MNIVKHTAQLDTPVNDFLLGALLLLATHFSQGPALNVIHDYIKAPMLVNKVNDAGDRRMVKGFDKVGFLYKAPDNYLAFMLVFDIADLLNSPLLVKGLVYCQVDSRHSAGADLCDDTVSSADYVIFTGHNESSSLLVPLIIVPLLAGCFQSKVITTSNSTSDSEKVEPLRKTVLPPEGKRTPFTKVPFGELLSIRAKASALRYSSIAWIRLIVASPPIWISAVSERPIVALSAFMRAV